MSSEGAGVGTRLLSWQTAYISVGYHWGFFVYTLTQCKDKVTFCRLTFELATTFQQRDMK